MFTLWARSCRVPLVARPSESLWDSQVVGFASAWSLWSVSRLPLEMALIDPKPAVLRYAITFVVRPVAGLLAQAIARWL
jgi:hypothetical protein